MDELYPSFSIGDGITHSVPLEAKALTLPADWGTHSHYVAQPLPHRGIDAGGPVSPSALATARCLIVRRPPTARLVLISFLISVIFS